MPSGDTHEDRAREYLGHQLGADAPESLVRIARFDEPCLAGEGSVTLFAFTAALAPFAQVLLLKLSHQLGVSRQVALETG